MLSFGQDALCLKEGKERQTICNFQNILQFLLSFLLLQYPYIFDILHQVNIDCVYSIVFLTKMNKYLYALFFHHCLNESNFTYVFTKSNQFWVFFQTRSF